MKQYVFNIMSVFPCLCYPACKSQLLRTALYCLTWVVWLYHISQHKLIKDEIFGKKSYRKQNARFGFVYYFYLKNFS